MPKCPGEVQMNIKRTTSYSLSELSMTELQQAIEEYTQLTSELQRELAVRICRECPHLWQPVNSVDLVGSFSTYCRNCRCTAVHVRGRVVVSTGLLLVWEGQ